MMEVSQNSCLGCDKSYMMAVSLNLPNANPPLSRIRTGTKKLPTPT